MSNEQKAAVALKAVYDESESGLTICDFVPSPDGSSVAEQLCNLNAYADLLLTAIGCSTQQCVDDACSDYETGRAACFTV